MDKIYTKTGDKGYTTNLLNKRYSKADIEMELQGGVDEINANIGYLRSLLKNESEDTLQTDFQEVDQTLKKIQYHLYQIGIEISTEYTETYITEGEVFYLEAEIDKIVENTEPMKSFIYYSGSICASFSHIIRVNVRRIERIFVRALGDRKYPVCYMYINRLSDYFFSLSRYLNHLEQISDEPMKLQ